MDIDYAIRILGEIQPKLYAPGNMNTTPMVVQMCGGNFCADGTTEIILSILNCKFTDLNYRPHSDPRNLLFSAYEGLKCIC